MIKQIICIALLFNYSMATCGSSSVAADAGGSGANSYAAGTCCYTAADTIVTGTVAGVQTCPTTGAANAVLAPTACATNYQLVTTTTPSSCLPCGVGYKAADGNTAATCTMCTDGQVASAAPGGCADATANATPLAAISAGCRFFANADKQTCAFAKNGFVVTSASAVDPCPAGQHSIDNAACANINPTTGLTGCRAYSDLAGTTCVFPKDGYTLTGTTLAPCAQDQWSASGSACAAITAGATGVAGCKVYGQVGATACVVPQVGKYLVNATSTGDCFAGCDECTGTTAALCTKAAAGKYIKSVTAAGTTTVTIEACSTDSLCATCTYNAAAVAPALTLTCASAVAGAYIDAGVAKQCDVGKGSPAGNSGAAASCLACTPAKNCKACSTVDICTSCNAGYVFNATPTAPATECTLFDVAKKHVTCKTASAEGDAGCNECDAADFRSIETEIVAPATTATAKAVGKCMCMEGYGEAATVVKACVPCGDQAKKCTINATGGITITECVADHFIAGKGVVGNKCLAKALTGQVGLWWDSVQSEYAACHATCSKCTAGTDSSCSECLTPGTSWAAAPAEDAAGYDTYLKAYWLNASQCFNVCPTDYVADEAQTACVAGSAGNSIILSIALALTIVVSILF